MGKYRGGRTGKVQRGNAEEIARTTSRGVCAKGSAEGAGGPQKKESVDWALQFRTQTLFHSFYSNSVPQACCSFTKFFLTLSCRVAYAVR